MTTQPRWTKKSDLIIFQEKNEDVIKWNLIGHGSHDNSAEGLDRQDDVVREECKETVDAWNNNDPVEFLDGLVDSFVTTGYEAFLTENLELQYQEYEQNGGDLYSFVVMMSDYFEDTGGVFQLMDVMEMLVLHGNWEAAIDEVLKSNWSKYNEYCAGDECWYDYHCSSLMIGGRYTGVTWRLNEGYVIWKDGSGKILKGPQYVAPDLKHLAHPPWGEENG